MRAERHPQEAARLAALRAYEILDTPPEAEFDDLVALASRACETPVAFIGLFDEDRQWFKAVIGLDVPESPYDENMCAHAIVQEGFLEVPDLTRDPRFGDYPTVLGEPYYRFYAATVLRSPEGLPLGTLCVMDVRSRELTDVQRETLRLLGQLAITRLDLRRQTRETAKARAHVDETLEFAGVARWEWDAGDDRVRTNGLLRRVFGMASDETGDLPLAEFLRAIHPEDRERVRSAIGAAVAGAPFETEYRVIDNVGVERWVLARGRLVDGTQTLSGVLVDVTEKFRALEALRRSEERFRIAQEMTPDAFTLTEAVRDEAGTIVDFRWTYVNPATERISGESKEMLVGASFLQMRPYTRETGQFDAFVRVVETGEPFTREFPVVYYGKETFLRITAVRVGDGVAVSFNDITDQKQAESVLREAVAERTKELREAVEEAERFNYSISHDLRTPLRAISATSKVLLDEAGPELGELHRSLLERQSHNARRLGLLIDQLLRLSRLGRVALTRGPLDMTEIARSVADEIGIAGEGGCVVEVQEGMAADGDPALVRLIFGNLLENACKFSKGQGTIRVVQNGDTFAVSDEGVGFDMRYAAKLFLPFERLVRDADFPGTGIGLANVERIVRRHGGRVWAESEPGQGATFFFTLG